MIINKINNKNNLPVVIILLDVVTEITSLLTNTINRKNDAKENFKTKYFNYNTMDIMKWPNYFWFIVGCVVGMFIMSIINSLLFCKIW